MRRQRREHATPPSALEADVHGLGPVDPIAYKELVNWPDAAPVYHDRVVNVMEVLFKVTLSIRG